MRLFLVEWKRFWSRRVMRWTGIVVMGLMVVSVGIAFTQNKSSGLSAKEYEAKVEEERQKCRDEFATEFGESGEEVETPEGVIEGPCENVDLPENDFWATEILGSGSDRTSDWEKEYGTVPERKEETTESGKKYTAPSGYRFGGIVPNIATFLLIVAVVFGGSFMGAEYRAGTLENLLLWEPNRLKVLFSKLMAGMVSAMVAVIGLLGFLVGLLFVLAALRGNFYGVDSAFWKDLALTFGRIGLISGAFFGLAMAIATITKHTVAAVASILGLSVVSAFISFLVPSVFRFELFNNAAAFIQHSDVSITRTGDDFYTEFSHSYVTGGVIVALWMIIPMVFAAVIFSRRDMS